MTKVTIDTLNTHIADAANMTTLLGNVVDTLDLASLDFLTHAKNTGDFTMATLYRNALSEGSANGFGDLRSAFTTWFTANSPAILRARDGEVVFKKDKSDGANSFTIKAATADLPSSYKKATALPTFDGLVDALAGYSFADRRDAIVKRAEGAGMSKANINRLQAITSVKQANAIVAGRTTAQAA